MAIRLYGKFKILDNDFDKNKITQYKHSSKKVCKFAAWNG